MKEKIFAFLEENSFTSGKTKAVSLAVAKECVIKALKSEWNIFPNAKPPDSPRRILISDIDFETVEARYILGEFKETEFGGIISNDNVRAWRELPEFQKP